MGKIIRTKVVDVEMRLIDRPSDIVRMEIDPDELIELARSIDEQGLLQAIVVNAGGGRFEIVAGDRRFLACRQLGWKKIQAKVVAMTPEQVALARGTENIQRRNLSPLEEGAIYQDLMTRFGMPADAIGKRMGKSSGVVIRRLAILNMPASFQKAIHARKVSVTVAEELLGCGDETHREYLIEMAIEHGITRDVARMWVGDYNKGLRRKLEGGGEGVLERNPMEPEIIYRPCDACKGPVDLSKVQELRMCPSCYKAVVSAIKGGGQYEDKA